MSFLSFARVARALRPATSRRFASSIASQSTRKSYRSLAWGATFGIAACLAVSTKEIHLDSPVQKRLVPDDAEEDTIVDPATSIAFPKTMRIPSNLKIAPLALVGVGVRTVSFLGVKVYSIGFYADLANPNLKIPSNMSPEDKIEHIVRNTACVVRIVPTRNTSYTHLRDAFMRALQARLSKGIKDETVTEEMAMAASSPMRVLKSLFPNSPLAKHTPLDIFLAAPIPNRPRPLVLRDLGSIEDDWVATEFFLNYFDTNCPSPALKNDVFENIKSFTK
ncbi:chalcone-flavanone isomerase-domain-containing protein [Flammula alnicola]|nr:chalcone-flavanone isomerase-domain-containing protein [Flammula alnicola]